MHERNKFKKVGFSPVHRLSNHSLLSLHPQEDFNSLCVAQSSTRACTEVCNFLTSSVIDTFKGPVDGDNLQHVMMELGVRYVVTLVVTLVVRCNFSGTL